MWQSRVPVSSLQFCVLLLTKEPWTHKGVNQCSKYVAQVQQRPTTKDIQYIMRVLAITGRPVHAVEDWPCKFRLALSANSVTCRFSRYYLICLPDYSTTLVHIAGCIISIIKGISIAPIGLPVPKVWRQPAWALYDSNWTINRVFTHFKAKCGLTRLFWLLVLTSLLKTSIVQEGWLLSNN